MYSMCKWWYESVFASTWQIEQVWQIKYYSSLLNLCLCSISIHSCIRIAVPNFVSMGLKQDFIFNYVLVLVTFSTHSSASVVVRCLDVHRLVTQQGIFHNDILERILENDDWDFYTSSHQILIANNLYLSRMASCHLCAGCLSSQMKCPC